jgi:5'-nucleotidase (lipoprotein e(P4) family)
MKVLSSVLLLLVVVGCATRGTQSPVAELKPEAEPAELTDAVQWMRNSAEYQAVMLQTYALASDRLRSLVADKGRGTWAVASDADETILDNSPYARDVLLNGRELTDAGWDAWVARRAAPPLPGAIEFLELVHQLGGHIAIVTNRRSEHCADTRANFRAFDIPFDVMLCREEDRRKEPRWERVENGTASRDLPPLEIVLWIGDNIQDFPGLDQSIRQEDAAAFGEFGYRFFAVPNPTYGSWSENPQD